MIDTFLDGCSFYELDSDDKEIHNMRFDNLVDATEKQNDAIGRGVYCRVWLITGRHGCLARESPVEKNHKYVIMRYSNIYGTGFVSGLREDENMKMYLLYIDVKDAATFSLEDGTKYLENMASHFAGSNNFEMPILVKLDDAIEFVDKMKEIKQDYKDAKKYAIESIKGKNYETN